MKRLLIFFVIGFLFIMMINCVFAQTLTASKIVIEAEHFSQITPSMQVSADNKASKGKCIEITLILPHGTDESGPSDNGKAVYKIKVPADGIYRFWARCWWYDGCGNSFFLQCDNKPIVTLGSDHTYKKYHWVKGPKLKLNQGIHYIRIVNREDGAKMDQWLLWLIDSPSKDNWIPVQAERETSEYIFK